MPKANTKKLIPVLLFPLFLYFSGCSSPEDKKAQSLEEISQLRAAGEDTTALAKLESLSGKFPDDSEILQQIGNVHQKLGNTVEAAFYLSAAFSLEPDNLELLYQNYRAQEAANQTDAAYELLEKLATSNPAAMTSELWLRLGELHAQAKKTQAALDAYLKGITSENEALDTETVFAIGMLYKELENLPKAERWLTMAANSKEPNALPALFELLDIYISNENMNAVEKTISQLDNKFPGEIEASEWADVRDELERWQESKAEAEEKLPEIANIKAVDQSAEPVEDTVPAATAPSGKAQIIIDVETVEALVNAPAREMSPEDEIEKPESNQNRITPDPNILIEPAEPRLDFSSPANQMQIDESPQDFSNSNNSTGTSAIFTESGEPLNSPTSADTFALTPQTLDDLLAQAEAATFEGDYEKAIRFYWKALGIAKDRADIWNMLSSVYLIDGQTKNAATTALEATRLDPAKVEYVLDYLRVVQRTKKPNDFIAELETALDRFPLSPEINLSLARAYSRVDKNVHAAKILYKRFIELAPNHPLRPEAEAALKQLP